MKRLKTFVIIILMLLLSGCSGTNNNYWYLNELKYQSFRDDGKNCIIAIIDTGLNNDYVESHKNNVKLKYNILNDSSDITDEHGHGTEMASIILGDKSVGLNGINPNASLYIVKALNEDGETDNSNIAKAIDYLLKCEPLPDIINLSLGSLNDDSLLQKAINNAIKKNIIVVASVGDYDLRDALYPSAYDGVIAVQSMNKDGSKSYMSNDSEQVTIRFPGENINVLRYNENAAFIDQISGSSAATALSSGYFSLFISICKNNSLEINNERFTNFLMNSIDDNKVIDYNKFYNTSFYGRFHENK